LRLRAFLDSSFLIYLNTLPAEERGEIDRLFASLLKEELFTNLLVLDELLYVSRQRYNFPYEVTLDFFRKVVLPCTEILPIEGKDMRVMEKYLTKYNLKPSDAIHLATMEKAGVTNIVTEDQEFDRIPGIKRIWI